MQFDITPTVFCLAALSSLTAMAAGTTGLRTETLRAEYLSNPIGLDEPKPRLSWTLAGTERNAGQSAYEVAVATTDALLDAGKPDLWDSGKVASTEQNQVEYLGRPLASRQGCVWRVRSWDRADRPGPWSGSATWEVGLADPSEWQARWIAGGESPRDRDLTVAMATYETENGDVKKDVTAAVRGNVRNGSLTMSVSNKALGGDPAANRVKRLRIRYTLAGRTAEAVFGEKADVAIPPRSLPYLRQTFRVDRPVVRARLYATALGLYAFEINGRRAGDHALAPDWTDYGKRVRYQAYDVTPLVKVGDNAIAGTVANGWYAGHIGNGGFQFWGKRPCVLAQLELTHADGSVDRVCTDERWRSHDGPILASDIMNGEDYDARSALPASDPGLVPDAGWVPVVVRTDRLPPAIDAQADLPVRELLTLAPRALTEPAPGHWVFDMGQNMVGVPRIKVAAPAGTTVTVRFAEMLNPDQTIYTTNYRGARSTDTYVCRGGGLQTWQPQFTFHGFRYVELTGLPGRPRPDAVTGVVLGSDTPSTGTFTCSDPRVNQLWSNIRWGQRGNFLGVPTDCPQRDERLGWMGDAQVFAGTAAYNADVAAFFTKWLVDVDDEQTVDGQFTNTAPEPARNEHGTPAWADAGVICPWAVHSAYGDQRVLARHLPAMMRWVDWCRDHSTNLIRDRNRGSDFGDWLSIGADTSKELLGTAFFAHSANLVARSAKAVGDDANAVRYAQLFDRVKAAFDAKYVQPGGRVAGETQTGYALALAFDLLPEGDRDAAAARLAANVRAKGNHLSTGFLGVSYLLPALSDHGQAATAHALLMQDTFPSWLFSVKHGATTIWERWDGWTPDHGFQNPGMNSFNHYSLGSCGRWMYERLAGLGQPAGGAGFRQLVIRPLVGGGGLTAASATYNSIRGPIRSGWTLDGDRLTLTVSVPPNVTATVHVPTASPASVRESGQPAAASPGVKALDADADGAVFAIGSGDYTFVAPWSAAR